MGHWHATARKGDDWRRRGHTSTRVGCGDRARRGLQWRRLPVV